MPTDVIPLITLPPYATDLKGNNEVRFHNPNEFPVLVVIRSGNKGMNLKVAADATGSALLPDGHYNISLVFATEPNALYRSERFDLPAPSIMEINISLFTRGSLGAGK